MKAFVCLQMVIVVDDEDRENEGDLIMAASLVTPEAMAFVVKHGTGIVCVSMKGEDLERLELPLMVTRKDNEEKLRTAFTVSVVSKTIYLLVLKKPTRLSVGMKFVLKIFVRMQKKEHPQVSQLVIGHKQYYPLHQKIQNLKISIVLVISFL